MLKSTLVTVVVNEKTNRIVPFCYGKFGEIIITSSGIHNENDLKVKLIDTKFIDWDSGEILDHPIQEEMEKHPYSTVTWSSF